MDPSAQSGTSASGAPSTPTASQPAATAPVSQPAVSAVQSEPVAQPATPVASPPPPPIRPKERLRSWPFVVLGIIIAFVFGIGFDKYHVASYLSKVRLPTMAPKSAPKKQRRLQKPPPLLSQVRRPHGKRSCQPTCRFSILPIGPSTEISSQPTLRKLSLSSF